MKPSESVSNIANLLHSRSAPALQLQNKSATRDTWHARFASSSRVDSESSHFLYRVLFGSGPTPPPLRHARTGCFGPRPAANAVYSRAQRTTPRRRTHQRSIQTHLKVIIWVSCSCRAITSNSFANFPQVTALSVAKAWAAEKKTPV